MSLSSYTDLDGIVSLPNLNINKNIRFNNRGNTISIGAQLAPTLIDKGEGSIAIGNIAGEFAQGVRSVALGRAAGFAVQGQNSVAIGPQAGQNALGEGSVVIGTNAGFSGFPNNSIALDATGTSTFLQDASNAFYVRPVREKEGTSLLQYSLNGEISHSNTFSGDISFNGNVDISGDLNLNCNLINDVSGIFFCDGTYIGQGDSFDISTNEVLHLKSSQTIELEASNYVSSTSAVSAPAFLSLNSFKGFPEKSSYVSNSNVLSSTSPLQFVGGVLAPNGKIYCVPSTSPYVLIIDSITNEVDTSSIPVSSDGSKWSGGVLAPNRKIYCAPDLEKNILVINPKNNTSENIPFVKNGRWAGAVLAPDNNIYCVPSIGDVSNNNLMSVLVLNPETEQISFIDTDLSGNDGNDDELFGGVLAPNGKIYCIPRNCPKILVIDTNTSPVSTYTLTKPTFGTSQWFFGCLGSDGIVYGSPRRANAILTIDPSGDDISGIPISEITNGYASANLSLNNKIYFAPFSNNTNILVLDLETNTTTLEPIPSSLPLSVARFLGLVSTPQNEIVMVPAIQDAVVRIRTGLPKLTNWLLDSKFNKL